MDARIVETVAAALGHAPHIGLSFERMEGSKRSCDAYRADERLEPGLPQGVTIRWTGTCAPRCGSAAVAVCAAQSHDTMARRAFAAGHGLRGIGETVGPLWPAPALSGHHRLSMRYLAADACHLTGMDRRGSARDQQHVVALPYTLSSDITHGRLCIVTAQTHCMGRPHGGVG
jgi:hypothetical protein